MFHVQQNNLVAIESKLKQLELGLDVHRVEVGEIRKQIDTIQAKSSGEKFADVPDQVDSIAEVKQSLEDVQLSQCNFRTDIDSRPNIQVTISKFSRFNFR